MPSFAERTLCAVFLSVLLTSGCAKLHQVEAPSLYYGNPIKRSIPVAAPPIPRELAKTALPDYVIEPPDILLIEAIRVVPKPPYQIGPFDVVFVQVSGTIPDRPIDGPYTVEPDGTVNLGPPYGSVPVAGLTAEEAMTVIHRHLNQILENPIVFVQLAETAAAQQITGEHIVGPDGKVSLGTYGKIFIAGMTQEQARATIEGHLGQYLENPQVAVELYAYNSKVYYVVTQGAGFGDGLARFPITGNETVLDAIADINGLESVSSKRIWLARPSPMGGPDQVLPVDWRAITERGRTETNYQVMPGDRIFIAEDRLVAMDTYISKIISPFERMFGFVALGTRTVSGIRFFSQGGTGFGTGF